MSNGNKRQHMYKKIAYTLHWGMGGIHTCSSSIMTEGNLKNPIHKLRFSDAIDDPS